MVGRRLLDKRVLMIVFVCCHPPGMHKGIDTLLCSGSNQHMEPHTCLPYFPNQRLSREWKATAGLKKSWIWKFRRFADSPIQ